MIPLAAAPSDTVEVANISGKRDRRDSSGGPVMNMDLFPSLEDGALSGDGTGPIRNRSDPVNGLKPLAPKIPIASCIPSAPRKSSGVDDHASLPSSTKARTKKKQRRKRTIDKSCAVTPTENDVLFGRGSATNDHRGNEIFRKRAQELRPWYERSTKEEKYRISELLVESVKSMGHRFLERDPVDDLWYEVIGNGARRKASATLRNDAGKRQAKKSGNAGSVMKQSEITTLPDLCPDDMALDGGLDTLSGGGKDPIQRLWSNFVKELLLLPKATATVATTAARIAKAAVPSSTDVTATVACYKTQLNLQQEERQRTEEEVCPTMHLTAKLERISTADEVAHLLNENFRMSSGEWVKYFESEMAGEILGPVHPTLFMS